MVYDTRQRKRFLYRKPGLQLKYSVRSIGNLTSNRTWILIDKFTYYKDMLANFRQSNFSFCEILRHHGKCWKCNVIRSVATYVMSSTFRIMECLVYSYLDVDGGYFQHFSWCHPFYRKQCNFFKNIVTISQLLLKLRNNFRHALLIE